MNKTAITVIIIIIAISAVLFICSYNKNNMTENEAKIAGKGEFIWPDGSFSFSYPEFEKWTSAVRTSPVVRIEYTIPEYEIYFTPVQAGNGPTPQIKIGRIDHPLLNIRTFPSNPNGVMYHLGTLSDTSGESGTQTYSLNFQGSDFSVDMKITGGNQSGFSPQAVVDEIIKTFRSGQINPIESQRIHI